jgi:hypothetical protein
VLPKPFRLEALEQQWMDDGVTARVTTHTKNEGMIRVESGSEMNMMGELVKFERRMSFSF